MHALINVKSSNNISQWQVGFNSAFKGLIWGIALLETMQWNKQLSHKCTRKLYE
jgi:hypothetical protein